jgi:hypothetical protein
MPPRILERYSTESRASKYRSAAKSVRRKTLNTVTAALMVDARHVSRGDHSLFLSGYDDRC